MQRTARFSGKKTKNEFSLKTCQKTLAAYPLLKKWSISDDGDRYQFVADTSERQKKNLIGRVDPLMPEINSFLDSFKDKPLSHEAILMGNLTELVSELK